MELSAPFNAMLPAPLDDDCLSVLNIKLSSFVYVLHIGRSVAAAIGHVFSSLTQETPESSAESQMKPPEWQVFQVWKSGKTLPLPAVDWEKDRGHTPPAGRPLKKALRRAEALNRIYETNQAEPSHYIFFTEQHPHVLPLISAVARVIGAERNQRVPSKLMSAHEAELQTLLKIRQIATQVASLSSDCAVKEEVIQKIRYLEANIKTLQQSPCPSRPGKRKQGQDTEVGGEPISTSTYTARPRLESLVIRKKSGY